MLLNFFNIITFAPFLLAMGKTKFYSNLHMYIAVGKWVLGYFTISTFNSPVALAILSVSLSILTVTIAFLYVAKFINVNIFRLIPFKAIASYAFHSIAIIGFINLILHYFLPQIDLLLKLGISSVSFIIIVIITGIPLKLNYLSVVQPFIVGIIKR